MKSIRSILVAVLVALLTMGGVSVAALGQGVSGEQRGLFGTVTALGPDSITLATAEGAVNVKVEAATKFRKGSEPATLGSIKVGERLAILARKSQYILTAQDVMVVPGQAIGQHVVGVVTAVQGNNITVMDGSGRTASLEVTAAVPVVGDALTVIVRPDSRGRQEVRSVHRSSEVEDRLTEGLQRLEREDARGRAADIEHLRDLVEDNAARHLQILTEVLDRVPEAAKGRIKDVLENARKSEGERLTRFGTGTRGPSIETMGEIKAIDAAKGTVTIQFRTFVLPHVLEVASSSRLHKDNIERASLSDLKVGDRVLAARFDPETKRIARLVAKSPKEDAVIGTTPPVDAEFSGVIESFSATELVVSGKKVAVNSDTKFKGRPQVGATARVEAKTQSGGALLAVEVNVSQRRGSSEPRDEIAAMGNRVEIVGTIESVSDTQIVIAGQKIVRNAQTEVKGELKAGAMAKVEGNLQADGTILAAEIKVPAELRAEFRALGNEVELVGPVESVSDTQIMVFGRKIARNAQTQLKGTLQVGALAKVEGSLQADGSILAREIKSPPDARDRVREAELQRAGNIELRGTIQSMTGTDIMVAGLKVVRDARTEVKGTLAAGATVKVEGTLQADGSILARQIATPADKLAEMQALGNLVELSGAIESVSASQLMVLGQKITTNAQTQVKADLKAGTLVKVEGSFQADGGILAREIKSALEVGVEIRGRAGEQEIRGREVEARGREAEGEAPRGADSGGDRGGGSGGGSSGGGGGSGGSSGK